MNKAEAKTRALVTAGQRRLIGLTYAEIGRRLGVTRQMAHQLCVEGEVHAAEIIDYEDSITKRFDKPFLRVLEALKTSGFGEYYDKYTRLLEDE